MATSPVKAIIFLNEITVIVIIAIIARYTIKLVKTRHHIRTIANINIALRASKTTRIIAVIPLATTLRTSKFAH
jgi:nitrogen fixation/metabolism regulation signal transduction histidine kinase